MPTEPAQEIYKKRHWIFIDNFIGGIGWGIGSILGAALIVALIGFAITQTKSIPFLNSMISIFSYQVQHH